MSDVGERCARGSRCVDAVRVLITTHPDSTVKTVEAGAQLMPDSCGLCDGCVRHIEHAIRRLPLDVVDLFALMQPTMEVRYRDPGMPAQPRTKKHPPLPFREDPLALAELIDHETDWWADSVADAAGLGRDRPAHINARVPKACTLLAENMRILVWLPEQEHPARSLTARRADGHDPDRTVRGRADYYVRRTGLEGALELLRLHELVVLFAGYEPAVALPLPCPACRRRTLTREHRARQVVCRSDACHHFMSDDAYERMSKGTLDDFLALHRRLTAEEAS